MTPTDAAIAAALSAILVVMGLILAALAFTLWHQADRAEERLGNCDFNQEAPK